MTEGNVMQHPRIAKVTLNMGVSEADNLAKAETILKSLTDSKSIRTKAKTTIPGLGVKKKQEVGCVVTLRGKKADEFLRKAFKAVEGFVKEDSFDAGGNFSFGIGEHIDIEGMKYDPKIGIMGMDVCVTVERPGYRVARRKRKRAEISKRHRLGKQASIEFIRKEYGVDISGG